MNRHALLVGLLTFVALTSASSQSGEMSKARQPGVVSPVGLCRAEGSAYQTRALTALRTTGTPFTPAATSPILAEARRLVRICTDKLSPDTLSNADLGDLASLDISTGDTASARRIVTTLLGKPGMSGEDRANALLVAETLAIRSFDAFLGRNPEAERIVSEVEALAGATLQQKVEAHRALLHRYDYADYDDGILQHSDALIAMGKSALDRHALGMTRASANGPSVDGAYPLLAEAYVTRARVAGDLLHADSALMILDEAKRIVGDAWPIAETQFAPSRRMYMLVGTRATPIDGQWWVNNPTGASVTPGAGKVSLIQFTAHWCVPCKHSYPGMLSMANHFAGKAYESIMATELYGFIGAKQNLTAEQEVAEDQAYYTTEHHLPMKVAITRQRIEPDTLTNDNDKRYAVGGIPEIVVVDKKGVIRATVVGWDNGNEKRLTAFIEKLLAEK